MSLRPRAVAAPRPGIRQLDVRGRFFALARRINLGLLAITLGGSLFVAYYTLKVSQWSVMSDELQYAKLGLSIGDTLSPIPEIRGAYTGSLAQLYPLLIAPFMSAFDMPTAFRAIHALNAVVMASTAIPAYLLTREIVRPRAAAYLVAALSISIPWMVMSTMMLTEVAAYPAFVWAILALQRSLAKPSPKRDVLALGGLFLAFLGRTQFLVMLPVFALVVVLHETGWSAAAERLPLRAAIRTGLQRAVRGHRVLAWGAVLGAVLAVPLAATGTIDRALGRYETTVHGGNFLPHGILHLVALHLDFVVVGIGVLPFVLAAAWAFGTLLKPSTKEGHAFAILSILTVGAIAFEATSFNLRFSIGGLIQDRYVFYVVPLLFVGMTACLLDERRRSLAVVAVGGAFAWLVSLASFKPTGEAFFTSPDTVWHPVLNGRAGNLGNLIGADITARPVIVIGTVVLSIAVALGLRRLPRQAMLLAVGLPVLAYCMAETAYVFHKVLPTINHGPPTTLAHRDWVDTNVPAGTKVGVLVAPINTNWDGQPLTFGPGGTEAWWQDTEFWNKSIDRTYLYGGYGDYAPFKTLRFSLDYRTGRADIPDAPPVIAMSGSDPRFGLASTSSKPWAMLLLRPARPYRAEWATRNIAPDGWTKPGVPARIRLYPEPGDHSVRRRLAIILQSSGEVTHARRFRVTIGSKAYGGVLRVGERHDVIATACVPAHRTVDGTITAATPPHDKPAGVRITRIRAWSLGGDCRAS
jgi:Dolichyl-phosphate-mannose-protein mannosyltransferase